MCLATVLIDGQREPVMRDVARIELVDGGLELMTLLGESKLLQAQIESIDLMSGRVVLRKTNPDVAEGSSGD